MKNKEMIYLCWSQWQQKIFFSIKDKLEIKLEYPANRAEAFKNNTIYKYKNAGKTICVLNGVVLYGANATIPYDLCCTVCKEL